MLFEIKNVSLHSETSNIMEDEAEWDLQEAKDPLGLSMGWKLQLKSFHSDRVYFIELLYKSIEGNQYTESDFSVGT